MQPTQVWVRVDGKWLVGEQALRCCIRLADRFTLSRWRILRMVACDAKVTTCLSRIPTALT